MNVRSLGAESMEGPALGEEKCVIKIRHKKAEIGKRPDGACEATQDVLLQ